MNSEQRLRLKRGARRRMLVAHWVCESCHRSQVGGKHNYPEENLVFKQCRYCGYIRVIK